MVETNLPAADCSSQGLDIRAWHSHFKALHRITQCQGSYDSWMNFMHKKININWPNTQYRVRIPRRIPPSHLGCIQVFFQTSFHLQSHQWHLQLNQRRRLIGDNEFEVISHLPNLEWHREVATSEALQLSHREMLSGLRLQLAGNHCWRAFNLWDLQRATDLLKGGLQKAGIDWGVQFYK